MARSDSRQPLPFELVSGEVVIHDEFWSRADFLQIVGALLLLTCGAMPLVTAGWKTGLFVLGFVGFPLFLLGSRWIWRSGGERRWVLTDRRLWARTDAGTTEVPLVDILAMKFVAGGEDDPDRVHLRLRGSRLEIIRADRDSFRRIEKYLDGRSLVVPPGP